MAGVTALKSRRRQFWRDKRVLLTGHTGFTGSWMSLLLHGFGAKVFGLSDQIPTDPSAFAVLGVDQLVDHKFGNVESLEDVRTRLKEANPDVILHLAAQPLVRRAFREPRSTFYTNVLGTLHVLEALRENRGSVRAVLNVTTDKVYLNDEEDRPFTEKDTLGGREPYSASKACSEWVTEAYRASYFAELPVLAARAGNIIGGGDWSEDRLLVDAALCASQGKTIEVRSPHSRRPWQHVTDLVRGYLDFVMFTLAGDTRVPNMNFGPDGSACWTVGEVMDAFCQTWGPPATWKNVAPKDSIKESRLLRLDASLAERELGWKPHYPTQAGIDQTVAWYRRYYAKATREELRGLCLQQFEQTEGR